MIKAKFEQQATLGAFGFNASPKLPAAQIRDLAALRWPHSSKSVILFGPVGVGKTRVAQALGHLAVRQGRQRPLRQDQPNPGRTRRRPPGSVCPCTPRPTCPGVCQSHIHGQCV
ncbi:ATP-binding protein [Streptomyces sp. 2MCAF27]